ncbi:hypothetical protein IWQ61_005272 [Dispira simplex]|nr:hypothetical protein IWQ61_005272 [Dispira simplex]
MRFPKVTIITLLLCFAVVLQTVTAKGGGGLGAGKGVGGISSSGSTAKGSSGSTSKGSSSSGSKGGTAAGVVGGAAAVGLGAGAVAGGVHAGKSNSTSAASTTRGTPSVQSNTLLGQTIFVVGGTALLVQILAA